MRRASLGLRGRGQAYALLIGVTTGMLAAGLAVPLLFGASLRTDAGSTRTTDAPLSESGPVLTTPGQEGEPTAEPAAIAPGGAPRGPGPTRSETPAGSSDAATTGAATSAGATQLRATDRGVTAASVKLGLLVIDLGGVEQIGFATGISVEGQKKAWQAYVDDVNARGGIAGRQVVPVYRTYDVLSRDSARAACLYLTQEAQVFAVIDGAGTFWGPPQLCVTEENETPLFSPSSVGTPRESFERSRGLLFTVSQAGDRAMPNFADQLDKAGEVRGPKIGILADERDRPTIDILENEITRRGGKIVHRTNFNRDFNVASSQVPLEVNAMRDRGADQILLVANAISQAQFVQTADSQRYYPVYRTSDWNTGSQDAAAENMPPSFEGTLSYAARRGAKGEYVAGMPETAVEKSCREVYERTTGEQLPPRDDHNYSLYTIMCTALLVVVEGGSAASPDLTRPGWSTSMQLLGPVELAALGPGSFRPGKFDAADAVRTYSWTHSCRCWVPVTAYREVAF